MELVRAADRYKDDGPCIDSSDDELESPLERFLDDVALIADIEPDNDEDDSGDKRIIANLMTIHASKGLEFDAVLYVQILLKTSIRLKKLSRYFYFINL